MTNTMAPARDAPPLVFSPACCDLFVEGEGGGSVEVLVACAGLFDVMISSLMS